MRSTFLTHMLILIGAVLTLIGCENEEADMETDPQIPISAASEESSEVSVGEDSTPADTENTVGQAAASEEEKSEMRIGVNVNGQDFTATLEDNPAAKALLRILRNGELTLELDDYGGFEKVGELGEALPSDDIRITAEAGDIVLYQSDKIVMFYGTNSWSYTRLGRIDDLEGWEEALGSGSAEVILSIKK